LVDVKGRKRSNLARFRVSEFKESKDKVRGFLGEFLGILDHQEFYFARRAIL
jgi:hypothetical protein